MATINYAHICPRCKHSGHAPNECLNSESDNPCYCTADCRLTEEIPVDPEELATKGTRADKGKTEYHLIPTEVLDELAKLFMLGAKKYTPNNWKRGMDYSRMYNSMLRHAFKFWRGENFDPDGQHHLDSVIWNAVCLRFFELYPTLYSDFDNREINKAYRDRLQASIDLLVKESQSAIAPTTDDMTLGGFVDGWGWPANDKLVIAGLLKVSKGKHVRVIMGQDAGSYSKRTLSGLVSDIGVFVNHNTDHPSGVHFPPNLISWVLEVQDCPFPDYCPDKKAMNEWYENED